MARLDVLHFPDPLLGRRAAPGGNRREALRARAYRTIVNGMSGEAFTMAWRSVSRTNTTHAGRGCDSAIHGVSGAAAALWRRRGSMRAVFTACSVVCMISIG